MTRKLLFVLSALLCFAGALAVLRMWQPQSNLPVLGSVPNFDLTERSGKSVSLNDLKGHVWVADFIFTSCAGSCPMMTQGMKQLRAQLNEATDVRFVSFSVDPKRDTPQVLNEYASTHGANVVNWLFLTGDEARIHELAAKGFMLAVQKATDKEPILHSQKFVLVDAEGRIRGYYDIDDPSAKQNLLSDIHVLIG